LDAFAHTVAHDLKNPLSLIIGFSDLLQSDAEDLSGDDVQNSINTIKTTGQKMTNIIDELLLLASVRQKAEVETTPLDMSLIVAEAKSRLQQMIAKYEGQLVVAAEWPTAVGYAPWVEEVWVNYISKALKKGGQPPHIELGATKDSVGQVCFWVKDNGSGLSEEEQAQLFTEFTRLHKTRAQGHGLGLSIVRRIVERLNGQVGIQQEPEGGSAFFFTLPKPPYLATE
jgi:signal transduction histidine kinase